MYSVNLSSYPISAVAQRSYSDLTVLPESRRPIISYGPPGRHAISGRVATVFGCTGFLGRYLVSKLAKAGTQVIVPYREEDEKRHLKVTGDLGQIVSLEWDMRNEEQIAECVRHSDFVYNLVGRDYETKNFTYGAVHVEGAERLARISAQNGVSRFIHVSHLNASEDSPSAFYRTKAAGEEATKKAFPNATIIRPGSMYGHEDRLLNSMAFYPILWKLNFGETKFAPVHVMDVAQALSNMTTISLPSQTLNLPGPTTYTYNEVLDLISAMTHNPPSRAPTVPKSIALFATKLAQYAWWPLLSPDEVERKFLDDIRVDRGDWDILNVSPEHIENVAIAYLRRYRSA
ncbi:uncharacterized protein EI90DRAFT_2907701 [Cantharellus anzutake]|uniref:uncharacterized protein n=1 Tax=Cantharellus anzutake TaxID=1750568 RepID=UPI0019066C8A|nr:uncharacterized protein EI90DRAFT_2907701 [Cantharellus anzutake]KAF8339595.1 hypothetical protein EI90DRAFT_2907701 [Cantharellus anzutake]